jgi:tetratricopeptide (TPR) repeat protein
MGAHYDRGLLLYQAKKFKLAEKEFRDELTYYSQSSMAQAMLALSLVAQNKGQKAHPEAVKAVELEPDSFYAQYTLSFTFGATLRLTEAEKAIREALRLSPQTAYLYARAAEVMYYRRKFAESLEFANQGLEIDANHEDCLVKRAAALVMLQRLDEADETIASVLRIAPENVQAHIEQGAVYLRRGGGEEQKAFACYREALRLRPSSEPARLGVIAALKSRNPIFYGIMRLSFWMKQVPPAVTIAVVFLAFNIPGLKLIACGTCLLIVGLEYAFMIMARFDPFARPFLKSVAPEVTIEERKRRQRIYLFALSPFVLILLMAIGIFVYENGDHSPTGLMRCARTYIDQGEISRAKYYYDLGAADAEKHLDQSQPAQSETLVDWLLTETAKNNYQDKSRVLQLALMQSQKDLEAGRLAQCEKTAAKALDMVPASDPLHAQLTKLVGDSEIAHFKALEPHGAKPSKPRGMGSTEGGAKPTQRSDGDTDEAARPH